MSTLQERTFMMLNKEEMNKIYVEISTILSEKDNFTQNFVAKLANKELDNDLVSDV